MGPVDVLRAKQITTPERTVNEVTTALMKLQLLAYAELYLS